MRAKSFIELLTLSTNLYMISKDDEFMQNLSEMLRKGKKKAEDIIEDFSGEGEEGEEQLIQKLLHKAQKAKIELEQKIEEAAIKVYEKMHIAHADEVKRISDEVVRLKREFALAEARIVNLEPSKGESFGK
jgi:polyhydroxyalkanoate synthesis regulator phasin